MRLLRYAIASHDEERLRIERQFIDERHTKRYPLDYQTYGLDTRFKYLEGDNLWKQNLAQYEFEMLSKKLKLL